MPTVTITKREQVIVDLAGGPATAGELGVSIGELKVLAGRGLVEFSGVKSSGRGRPAHAYKLTAEGKKLARRLKRKHG